MLIILAAVCVVVMHSTEALKARAASAAAVDLIRHTAAHSKQADYHLLCRKQCCALRSPTAACGVEVLAGPDASTLDLEPGSRTFTAASINMPSSCALPLASQHTVPTCTPSDQLTSRGNSSLCVSVCPAAPPSLLLCNTSHQPAHPQGQPTSCRRTLTAASICMPSSSAAPCT